jgi:hypothetical protein
MSEKSRTQLPLRDISSAPAHEAGASRGETFAQRAEGKEVNGSDYRANDLNDAFSVAEGTIPDRKTAGTSTALKLFSS